MAFGLNSKIKHEQVGNMNIQVRSCANYIGACLFADSVPVAAQIQEMQMVREKVYAMEQTHLALKAKSVSKLPSRGPC